MINIASWLEIFSGRLEANFPGRIWFMGLQGSYARGEALRRAVKIGACNVYHACVHNFLHERDTQILKGLYKSAAFVLQAEYFRDTGQYVRSHRELSGLVSQEELEILCPDYDRGFDDLSGKLFAWTGRKILESKSVR